MTLRPFSCKQPWSLWHAHTPPEVRYSENRSRARYWPQRTTAFVTALKEKETKKKKTDTKKMEQLVFIFS